MSDWLAKAIEHAFRTGGPNALINNKTLLHLAVALNRFDLVRQLLSAGADCNSVDRRGRTPLFFATSGRMAKVLVDAGATIDHPHLVAHTPLHAAVRAGRVSVARALAEVGADIDALDLRGQAAIHRAAQKGRRKCLALLIARGAGVEVADRRGRTPLYYALACRHIVSAQTLIQAGASLDAIDDEGTSWLELVEAKHIAVLQRLALEGPTTEHNEWSPEASTLAPRSARTRLARHMSML